MAEWIGHRIHRQPYRLTLTVDVADGSLIAAVERPKVNDVAIYPEDRAKLPPPGQQWIFLAILRVSGDDSILAALAQWFANDARL